MEFLKLFNDQISTLVNRSQRELHTRKCGLIRHSTGFKSKNDVQIGIANSKWTWRDHRSAIVWWISYWKRITCCRRSSSSTSSSTMAATIKLFAWKSTSPIRLIFLPIRSRALILSEVRSLDAYNYANTRAVLVWVFNHLFCVSYWYLHFSVCWWNCSTICVIINLQFLLFFGFKFKLV